jgi:DNA-binding NtrC family response regulator
MGSQKAVVLIVEDEPLIRFATLDALEEVGYTALEAGNADEAMVLFRNRTDIDIVFTDVNMAGSMDGIQLSQRIRAIRPGVGIIITSGIVNLDPMLLPTNTVFLPKPYRHEGLLDAIYQLMP